MPTQVQHMTDLSKASNKITLDKACRHNIQTIIIRINQATIFLAGLNNLMVYLLDIPASHCTRMVPQKKPIWALGSCQIQAYKWWAETLHPSPDMAKWNNNINRIKTKWNWKSRCPSMSMPKKKTNILKINNKYSKEAATAEDWTTKETIPTSWSFSNNIKTIWDRNTKNKSNRNQVLK